MTDKDKTLIAGCLKGEKAAWDTFVQQYSNLVYHAIKKTFCLYHTEPRTEQIEDLYQDFFLAIVRDDFKKLRQFRGDQGCRLASWLRVIAGRLTIDFLRRKEPSQIEATDAVARDGLDQTDSLINENQEKLLTQALLALSSRDRMIVDLCYRQDLPVEEVAAILRTSVSAVYTNKSRVLDKIRAILRTSGFL